MKCLALLCCVFAVSQAFPARCGLRSDLEDFKALVPYETIAGIIDYFVENDRQVSAIVYVGQNELGFNALARIFSYTEVMDVYEWALLQFNDDACRPLGTAAVDVDKYIPDEEDISKKGMDGLLNAIMPLLPKDKLLYLARKKIFQGGSFSELYFKIKKLRSSYELIIKEPPVMELLDILSRIGLEKHINLVDYLIRKAFGWM